MLVCSFVSNIHAESYVTGTALDLGFFGLVFGARSSSNFFVAQWKYAGAGNVDRTTDAYGLYGSTLYGAGGSPAYYSTAGLVIKR